MTTPHSLGPQLTVLTFNLLAPCYKRLFSADGTERSDREADHQPDWTLRLETLLTLLINISPLPDVICLQEFWFHSHYISIFERILSPHFHIFYAQRPDRQDGLATLVLKQSSILKNPTSSHILTLDQSADRIALAVNASVTHSIDTHCLILNTHLTFPHCAFDSLRRQQQATTLASYVDQQIISFKRRNQLLHVCLMGDFNSDNQSPVASLLHHAHFVNCYNLLHGFSAAPKTHRNHRHQSVHVDHVFIKSSSDHGASSQYQQRRCHRDDTTISQLSNVPARHNDHENYDAHNHQLDQQDGSGDVCNRVAPPVFKQPRRRQSAHGVTQARFDHGFTSDDTDVDMDCDNGSDASKSSVASAYSASKKPTRRQREHKGSLDRSLQPTFAQVLPKSIGSDVWPMQGEYNMSDHRPVLVTLRII